MSKFFVGQRVKKVRGQPAEWKNCLWQPEHLKSTA